MCFVNARAQQEKKEKFMTTPTITNHLYDSLETLLTRSGIDGIMLSGLTCAGKDTIADLLEKKFGFKRFSFAAALKEECVNMTGLPYVYFDSHTYKDSPLQELNGNTPRTVLINHAHKRREEYPLCFVKIVVDKIKKERCDSKSKKRFIITDCGFPNEKLHVCASFNTVLLWVKNPNMPGQIGGRPLKEEDCHGTLHNDTVGFSEKRILEQLIAHLDGYVSECHQ